MSMETVRNLSARATRARLMNPPGGRESSELEVVPACLARARKPIALPVIVIPALPARTQEEIDRDRRSREAAFIEAWTFAKTKTMRSIIGAGKMHFNRTGTEIKSRRRTVAIVRPRQIIAYLAKEHTTLSLPQIGLQLGGFDHTTVLHGVRKIALLLADGNNAVTYDVAHMENLLGIR